MIRWSGEEVILSSTLSATITRQVERKISKEAKLSLIPPIKIFTQISVPTKVEMSMESRTSSNMFLSIIRRRCISVTLEASQSSKILTIVLLSIYVYLFICLIICLSHLLDAHCGETKSAYLGLFQ